MAALEPIPNYPFDVTRKIQATTYADMWCIISNKKWQIIQRIWGGVQCVNVRTDIWTPRRDLRRLRKGLALWAAWLKILRRGRRRV